MKIFIRHMLTANVTVIYVYYFSLITVAIRNKSFLLK